jgi:hypothetical protein
MNVQVFKVYSHQGLCRAIDVYNYPWDFPSITRILGYRFLFQWKHKEPVLIPKHEKVVEEIKKMILDNIDKKDTDSKSVLMDLVDILLEFDKPTGEELLHYLQQAKITAHDSGPTTEGVECTVYSDAQSTHTPSLTKSVKAVSQYLCDKYEPDIEPQDRLSYMNGIESKLKSLLPDKEEIVDDVLLRICCDNAVFGWSSRKNKSYHADIVLFSIWNWISLPMNGHNATALYQRLTEELLEMHRYCSTRLVSGMINIIQGFTDEEGLQVRIGDREQCKAVVYTYVTKQVQECENDAVMEGLVERNSPFLRFMIKVVNAKRNEWKKEYGDDFAELVSSVVNEYAGQSIFAE